MRPQDAEAGFAELQRGRMRATAAKAARPLIARLAPIAASAGAVFKPWRNHRSRGPGVPPSRPLGRLGDLEVRLAASPAEVQYAQALRYRVFYDEMSAVPSFKARRFRRDADRFDPHCDHLLAIDHRAGGKAGGSIVGTYRLLRRDVAEASGGFYSDGEFDLSPLLTRKPTLAALELGRSCVLPPYRNRRTLELLWHGIWTYVLKHESELMIGCASLEGTNLAALRPILSFLHHHCRAPDEWRVSARSERRAAFNPLPPEALDEKAVLRSLPPLLKGYLRLGAYVGDGAVVDPQFGTTDVCVILPVGRIAARYVSHYGPDASRYAVSGTASAGLAAA